MLPLARYKVAVIATVLVFAAAIASGALEANPPLPALVARIRAEVNPNQAMEYMRRVYSTDRWFTFPKFAETAGYLKETMQGIGLEQVQVVDAPADGVTQEGFWTMPMAWDVKQARLEIVDPAVPADESVLADYRDVPTSACEWSGPTPAGGITADVVEIKDWPDSAIAKMDLRGKIAMTDENPADIKWALVKAGAAAVVNAGTEEPSLLDARQWVNAWGDNGWAFIKSSTPLPCLSITPRGAALVRRLMAQRGAVRVKATVDSRLYAGTYPYTTGVIPGTGPEEVLALGHTGEEGAGDNASGVAALVEAMATLNRLIAGGVLPRPKRSIRLLTMPEMYDSMHYIAENRDRIRRTVAAMCLDTPAGRYDLAGSVYTFYLNPEVASSYTDAFILKVADEYFSKIKRPWHEHPAMSGTDSYLGEPTIGVPTAWAYSGNDVNTPHHSSADTPDKVDPRSLGDLAIVSATYLYYIANAGEPEALWLAEVAQTRGFNQIAGAAAPFLDQVAEATDDAALGKLLAQGIDKVDYTVGRQIQAVHSVLRLLPSDDRARVAKSLAPLEDQLARFGDAQSERLRIGVNARARLLAVSTPVKPIATPNPEAAAALSIVVKRKRFGTIPLDDLPVSEREGYPSGAWAMVPITALYWCDGTRNLAEVIHLTEMELGPTKFDFVGYFKFLARHGYVTIGSGSGP